MQKQAAIRVILPTIGCLAAGIGIGWAFAPRTNLYINGALASSHVFQHDGAACAPIADIARALNQSVVLQPDGYAITAAGGANQVSGSNGKVGDKLSNGQFTLTVVKVIRTDHYQKQFDTGDATPSDPSNDLVVVVCRVKNAYSETVLITVRGGGNTALTDQDEHSYEASRFSSDVRGDGVPRVLPGSAVDFALGFNVPKNEKLGDLVYQINAGGVGKNLKETNFRVSLASANQ